MNETTQVEYAPTETTRVTDERLCEEHPEHDWCSCGHVDCDHLNNAAGDEWCKRRGCGCSEYRNADFS